MDLTARLVQNAAFLLALLVISDPQGRWPRGGTRTSRRCLRGIFLGGVAISTMLFPVRVEPGLVLDTRGIVLALAGVFAAPLCVAIAATMAAAYRALVIGGPATLVGVSYIIGTALLGLFVRRLWKGDLESIPAWRYVVLGLMVGAFQLVLAGYLLGPTAPELIASLAPGILLVHGVATPALGLLMRARLRHTRLHRELAERETSFRTLTEHFPGVVYRVALDATSRPLYISPRAESLGIDPVEWTRTPGFWAERVHPEDRDAVSATRRADRDAGHRSDLRYRLRHADGSYRVIRDIAEVVTDEAGERLFLQGVLLDVTEHERQAEESRLRSRALDAAADGIVLINREGRIEWANRGFTALTGYSPAEAQGRSMRQLLEHGTENAADYDQMCEALRAGRSWHGQVASRRKDGMSYYIEQTVTPFLDEAGNTRRFIAITRDVTARLELEAQFRQAQKMEGIGRLAGGVAHDLNNLLTVINGTIELTLPEVATSEKIRSDLLEIRRATDRAAKLTRQMLAFSRQQVLRIEVLDLNEVVAAIMSMITRVIGEDVQVERQLAGDLRHIRADESQLEQVILNLAVNARDAMPGGGTITVQTANVELDQAFAAAHVTVTPGPHVLLRVSDTGVGMDAATMARVFEPFFTTKEPGKGTGLGLATVYGIVKQSGGTVWVESSVGRGATFSIYFPVVHAPIRERASGPSRLSTATRGSETVLVVEDEDAIRHVATRVLTMQGYRVLDAPSGPDALRVAEQFDGTINLLVTDMVMPGMSGPQLAHDLRAARPELRVLFTSGYSADAVAREFGLTDDEWRFISKPYGLTELARAVREAIDGTEA